MANERARHLVLGQAYRLEAGRCEEGHGKLSAKAGSVVCYPRSAAPFRQSQTPRWPRRQAASGMGVACAQLADKNLQSQRAHSVQCSLLPHGRVDGAQPPAAGSAVWGSSEMCWPMDRSRRLQHGTWGLRAICHANETTRSAGHASSFDYFVVHHAAQQLSRFSRCACSRSQASAHITQSK